MVSQRRTTLRARVSSAILEAAAAALAERGEQASRADVAAAPGWRATVFRYFPNREALFEALERVAVEEAGERLPHRRQRAPDATVAGRGGHGRGDHVAVPGRRSTTMRKRSEERRVGKECRS